jgi:hypothetical protein
MSDEPFTWSALFNWIVDLIAFPRGTPSLRSRFPKIESHDGQEPTAESLREEARQADAKQQTEKPKKLSSQDRKSLDKEFWETL